MFDIHLSNLRSFCHRMQGRKKWSSTLMWETLPSLPLTGEWNMGYRYTRYSRTPTQKIHFYRDLMDEPSENKLQLRRAVEAILHRRYFSSVTVLVHTKSQLAYQPKSHMNTKHKTPVGTPLGLAAPESFNSVTRKPDFFLFYSFLFIHLNFFIFQWWRKQKMQWVSW